MSFHVVHAAYAYSWTVDGETLRRDGSAVKNGTAKWIESDEYTGGILVLENYSGGQIKIACRGTGMGHVFAVKLVGDNTINAENGVGVVADEPVVFIGDGSLTINAAIPIGSGSIQNSDNTLTEIDKAKLSGSTTLKIVPSKVEVPVVTTTEETKEETPKVDAKEEKETEKVEEEEKPVETTGISKTTYLIIIGCVVGGLLLLAFIISCLKKKK